MITAAHCFSVGDYVYNGASTLNLGNNNMYGKVTLKDISNGGVDAELINTSGYGGSSRLIFTGSSTNPYTAAVSGATTSLKSYQVCQSGAFEGEICGLVIQVSDECLTVGGRYICHVVEATNTSGGIAVGQGDSGGPVFRFNGSYLYATGISTAGSNTVPCSNYPSNRSCFSTLYYTNINSILSSLGVSLN